MFTVPRPIWQTVSAYATRKKGTVFSFTHTHTHKKELWGLANEKRKVWGVRKVQQALKYCCMNLGTRGWLVGRRWDENPSFWGGWFDCNLIRSFIFRWKSRLMMKSCLM